MIYQNLYSSITIIPYYKWFYYELDRLDANFNLCLQPREKKKYPEVLFGIKKDLLEMASSALLHNKYLVYAHQDELHEKYLDAGGLTNKKQNKIVTNFYQHVLNRYYENCKGYELQLEDFSYKDFIAYLSGQSLKLPSSPEPL